MNTNIVADPAIIALLGGPDLDLDLTGYRPSHQIHILANARKRLQLLGADHIKDLNRLNRDASEIRQMQRVPAGRMPHEIRDHVADHASKRAVANRRTLDGLDKMDATISTGQQHVEKLEHKLLSLSISDTAADAVRETAVQDQLRKLDPVLRPGILSAAVRDGDTVTVRAFASAPKMDQLVPDADLRAARLEFGAKVDPKVGTDHADMTAALAQLTAAVDTLSGRVSRDSVLPTESDPERTEWSDRPILEATS